MPGASARVREIDKDNRERHDANPSRTHHRRLSRLRLVKDRGAAQRCAHAGRIFRCLPRLRPCAADAAIQSRKSPRIAVRRLARACRKPLEPSACVRVRGKEGRRSHKPFALIFARLSDRRTCCDGCATVPLSRFPAQVTDHDGHPTSSSGFCHERIPVARS